MKTLANCKASEFLRQANKIRHKVEEYYKAIGIAQLKEKFKKLAETAEDNEGVRKQYLSELLDTALDENAEATVEIIGLACFKNAEEAEEMSANEVLEVAFSLIGSKPVMDFFISVVKSGLLDMANT